MSANLDLPLEGRRILVVEDELMIAMEMEALLEAAGSRVVGPASSCEKALALIEDDGLDACVLDLNLNGKPVTSVAKELNRRGVPFVLVSGYSHIEMTDPELQGAERLTKPVDEKQIVKVLGKITSASINTKDGGTEPRD